MEPDHLNFLHSSRKPQLGTFAVFLYLDMRLLGLGIYFGCGEEI